MEIKITSKQDMRKANETKYICGAPIEKRLEEALGTKTLPSLTKELIIQKCEIHL